MAVLVVGDRVDPIADRGTAMLESLEHDNDRLLLVHPFMATDTIDYAVHNYPVPWSFIPGGMSAIQDMQQRYGFGTVFFVPRHIKQMGFEEPPPALYGGLRYREKLVFDGNTYHVYQRRR